MNKEVQEAMEDIKSFISFSEKRNNFTYYEEHEFYRDLGKRNKILLNYISKQDKVIDLMAKTIMRLDSQETYTYNKNEDMLIEEFYKEVEKENG